jgi:tripartite-type tricarboxylate transporter receptor subunit TctC
MKREDRQLRKNERQRRSSRILPVGVAIFALLFLMASDGKAADPSADYPSKSIEIVVQTSPGGSNDVYSRMVGGIIEREKILSQPMVVTNKVGGGGAVAMAYAFERKGNPHLILCVSVSFIITPLIENLPYNYKSFVPIANLISEGSVMVVRNESPFKTIDDLVAEARKRPKQLIMGIGAPTSNEAMMGQSMQKVKGVQWNFIPFSSEPEALNNILSGSVDFIFLNPVLVMDHVRAGKLRVLLAGAPVRYPQFKDAPTIREAGMGEPFMTNRGFVGAPNMPDYAVKKLEAAFKKVMQHDQFKKYMGEMGMIPAYMSLNEYGKFLEEENNRWNERLRELNLLKKK